MHKLFENTYVIDETLYFTYKIIAQMLEIPHDHINATIVGLGIPSHDYVALSATNAEKIKHIFSLVGRGNQDAKFVDHWLNNRFVTEHNSGLVVVVSKNSNVRGKNCFVVPTDGDIIGSLSAIDFEKRFEISELKHFVPAPSSAIARQAIRDYWSYEKTGDTVYLWTKYRFDIVKDIEMTISKTIAKNETNEDTPNEILVDVLRRMIQEILNTIESIEENNKNLTLA